MPIKVIITEQFTADTTRLSKHYPKILKDIRVLRTELEAGELPGDRISGLAYRIYKARVKNSDARRGKSGGYRVIYYLETAESRVLITIYSKSDHSDIPVETLRRYLAEYMQK